MNREINAENAIYINDQILCQNEDTGYGHFGVDAEDIDRFVIAGDVVRCEWDMPYEDNYVISCEIPKIYFCMSDDKIIEHAIKAQKAVDDFYLQQDMLKLKHLADKLGYELIKKGE